MKPVSPRAVLRVCFRSAKGRKAGKRKACKDATVAERKATPIFSSMRSPREGNPQSRQSRIGSQQIKSHRERVRPRWQRGFFQVDRSPGHGSIVKPCRPPRLGFDAVDGEPIGPTSGGMNDMVGAAPHRNAMFAVDQFQPQRRMNANRRVQAPRGLPSPIANPGDVLPRATGRVHRNRKPVAKYGMPNRIERFGANLKPLDAAVDKPRRATRTRLFAHHEPRFDRIPQRQRDIFVGHAADPRKAELKVRPEPIELQAKAALIEKPQHVGEVAPDKNAAA